MKVLLAIVTALSLTAPVASAHSNPCHSKHDCPSDHASYVWSGKLCVDKKAKEFDKTFKSKLKYAGRTYYCKKVKR
jgi:hypothetical protein